MTFINEKLLNRKFIKNCEKFVYYKKIGENWYTGLWEGETLDKFFIIISEVLFDVFLFRQSE
jgi:hypothetical protein